MCEYNFSESQEDLLALAAEHAEQQSVLDMLNEEDTRELLNAIAIAQLGIY